MPAPPLTNTFESSSAADGTTITTGNSGSGAGDAFSAAVGGTAAPVFSTDQAHSGSFSEKVDTSVTGINAYVGWTGLGSLTTDVYGRAYLYMTAFPVTGSARAMTFRASGGGACAFLMVGVTDGFIRALNAAQGIISTGSVAVALNQWIRLEWHVVASTTVGVIDWRLYNSADSATITDSGSASSAVLAANVDQARFGQDSSVAQTWTGYFDDLVVSTAGWVGPSTAPVIESAKDFISASRFGPF